MVMKGALPGKLLSTIDLAGYGLFTLLTGHGGNAWKLAAERASKVLSVPINYYSIGWGWTTMMYTAIGSRGGILKKTACCWFDLVGMWRGEVQS